MSVAKLLLQAAAGNAGGAGLDITDVFSTYLYNGNDSTQAINNGIDLDGEGGLLWIKPRDLALSHRLMDSARGPTKYLVSDTTGQQQAGAPFSFGSNGFSLTGGGSSWNQNTNTYASWTFRKAKKFFDVVTWTGDGSGNRQISHNLGSTPGMMLIKITSEAGGWAVYHRGNTANPETDKLQLHTNAATSDQNDYWADTAPTSANFTVGSDGDVNQNYATYVAYLFAHNDGDGEFGPDGDQDIIKCGSYTGNATSVDLGFEPQFIIVKRTDAAENWMMFDTMRGWAADGSSLGWLMPHRSSPEYALTNGNFGLTSTGFSMSSGYTPLNSGSSNHKYIYMAIRRGPLAPPEAATEVFDVGLASETGSSAPEYVGGFVVDMAIKRILSASNSNYVVDRLRSGRSLTTNTNGADDAFGSAAFDYMTGYYNGTSTASAGWSAMWKRAPSFFDVVAFLGNGTAGRTVSHNLGVAPEMMWVKVRSIVEPWVIYHKGMNGGTTPEKYHMRLTSGAESEDSDIWNNTAPTSSVFTTGGNDKVNANNQTYIAYLFATVAGISKVGSVTKSGSSVDVNCGFSNGARFVMLKSTASGNWNVWDSLRGIVSGNDPFFKLDSDAAPSTNGDYIDPLASGFTITGDFGNGDYIFYAIA